MLGLLYLLWIFIIGYYLMLKFTPWFDYATLGSPETDKPRVPAWMLQLPFAWILGALVVNWINFFLCNFNRSISTTLFTMTAAGTAAVWIVLSERKKTDSVFFTNLRRLWQGTGKTEIAYTLLALALAAYTNLYTLTETANEVRYASAAFGDLVVHTSLIHSFSLSNNFPPQYPYFSAGDMPYHFLFQFLAASLESLGLPFALSFNIPSIISLFSMILLVYVAAVQITKLRAVAVLALIFIFFRASFAFIELLQHYHISQIPEVLSELELFIGKTQNARWGMWVFFNSLSNQRHLSFGISTAMIGLILMYPVLIKSLEETIQKTATSWGIQSLSRAVFVGIFLGVSAFWNGATLLAALMVLAGFALRSQYKSEYIIIAIIAIVLGSLQSHWFIAANKEPIKATFNFGFLANEKTIPSVTSFILQAYGLLIPLFIIAAIYFRKNYFIAISISIPFIFSFFVQPTIDINLNHKFILFSQIYMCIFVAWLLINIWQRKSIFLRISVVICALIMTATGISDAASFHNVNQHKYGFQKNNDVTNWVLKNTSTHALFLTELATINPILYAGRQTYLGWPYYGWSAGYDTSGREQNARKIFGSGSKVSLQAAVEDSGIDYIVVTDPVRRATNYVVNENLIAQTYPIVFEASYENTKIYQTRETVKP